MADKVTSLQVAERAGVSQSAVSRVFTPGASVSAKTAAKVRKAARMASPHFSWARSGGSTMGFGSSR